jgi:hypothetical protein
MPLLYTYMIRIKRIYEPSAYSHSTGVSTSVQRRDKDDLVAVFQSVIQLSFELPVGVIDEHQDSRASE